MDDTIKCGDLVSFGTDIMDLSELRKFGIVVKAHLLDKSNARSPVSHYEIIDNDGIRWTGLPEFFQLEARGRKI